MSNQQTPPNFIRLTILRGVFFIVPLVIILYVLEMLYAFMGRIALKIYPGLNLDGWFEIVLINAIAIIVFLFVAFIAGLSLRYPIFQPIRKLLSNSVAKIFPAYSFFKAYTEDMVHIDKSKAIFIPVLISTGSSSRIGFKMEEYANGGVAVYLPGTPNPWAGQINYFEGGACKELPISLREAIEYCRTPGNKDGRLAVLLREMNR